MSVEYLAPAVEDRALTVQLVLAGKGRTAHPRSRIHSSRPPPSLLPVLQLDRDFDLVAAITGQPCERLEV